MEYKLVIKDYNSLYTIYLTKLCKVLVGVIISVRIVIYGTKPQQAKQSEAKGP